MVTISQLTPGAVDIEVHFNFPRSGPNLRSLREPFGQLVGTPTLPVASTMERMIPSCLSLGEWT